MTQQRTKGKEWRRGIVDAVDPEGRLVAAGILCQRCIRGPGRWHDFLVKLGICRALKTEFKVPEGLISCVHEMTEQEVEDFRSRWNAAPTPQRFGRLGDTSRFTESLVAKAETYWPAEDRPIRTANSGEGSQR